MSRNPTSPASSPYTRPANDADSSNESSSPPPVQFSHTHALLKLRLAPLRRVEADLKQLIGAASDEITGSPDLYGNGSNNSSNNAHRSGSLDDINAAAPFDPSLPDTPTRRRPSEYYVRSNTGWRDAVRSAYHKLSGPEDGGGGNGRTSGTGDGDKLEDATEIIASCAEDMQALWQDPTVKDMLRRRKIKMELAPGL